MIAAIAAITIAVAAIAGVVTLVRSASRTPNVTGRVNELLPKLEIVLDRIAGILSKRITATETDYV